MYKNDKDFDARVIEASETSDTMAEAARKLGINYKTYKTHALRLQCFIPNQGGKGTKKVTPFYIPLEDILNGEHPIYQTYKLKNRLVRECIKEWKCEVCGRVEWNNSKIPLELHHINGDSRDHRLDNLEMICPNCHSMTDNYRGNNK
jgi:5-methylcytosine-specific restriction endonuclease McrA